MTSINDAFPLNQNDPLIYDLQKELENFSGEYSKLSEKNSKNMESLSKEYQSLLNSREEFDHIMKKENDSSEIDSSEISPLDKFKATLKDVSEEYHRNKQIILKNNKKIDDHYSKVKDIIDTINHLKSKKYDEETIVFMAKKLKQNVPKLQNKNINELILEADKALYVINEIKSTVGHCFYKERMCFCDEYHIDTALIPCGHTFCFECISNSTKCHMCRSEFTSKLKLYFN